MLNKIDKLPMLFDELVNLQEELKKYSNICGANIVYSTPNELIIYVTLNKKEFEKVLKAKSNKINGFDIIQRDKYTWKNMTGIIIKAIGGLYTVDASEGIFECKARGIFRKKGLSPVVGDNVVISIEKEGYAAISEILPRKNSIVRPAVANIDKLFIVSSVCEPEPNLFIVDKMTATAFYKNIEPVLIFSKSDMLSAERYLEIYEQG